MGNDPQRRSSSSPPTAATVSLAVLSHQLFLLSHPTALLQKTPEKLRKREGAVLTQGQGWLQEVALQGCRGLGALKLWGKGAGRGPRGRSCTREAETPPGETVGGAERSLQGSEPMRRGTLLCESWEGFFKRLEG